MFKLFKKKAKKNFLELNSFLVLGDSHTRGFSFNDNFLPFFLGQGKEHCFISDENYLNIKKKVDLILSRLSPNTKVILYFGEPDTRYYLGKGWTPWTTDDEYQLEDIERKLYASSKRYLALIKHIQKKFKLDLFVLNITHSNRPEQNEIVDQFNKILESNQQKLGYQFIQFNEEIYDSEKRCVKEEYLGDPVHLNNKIQIPVENWLLSRNLISEIKYADNPTWNNKEVQGKYAYNERFGCYTLKE